MIAFQNVSKYYEHQSILKNITFTIQKGEMAFLTGPSGAGKSTLLKLMYLAEWPDEGNIVIGDFQLQSLSPSQIPMLRRSIGVVFQDFKLINTLSVFDNVALSLRIKGAIEKDIKNLVSGALKRVHLRHLSDSYPLILSGGEQQRVAIARAIVTEPLVLLADEPTGNLDPNTAIDIIKLFEEINLQGTTIIIATHNKELFKNTKRRVLKLDSGSLIGEEVG
ncbi:cell division ATP-binding protein FtsE [hot springs metagenome]|uniref:Cell division ATP-binding protein FtsE n=1 Tax=hot springs metagenome TaxID=433727 RepID=A0A5J4L3B8_9ZZZZ